MFCKYACQKFGFPLKIIHELIMSEISDDFRSLVLSENIFKDVKYYVSGNVDDKVLELLKNGGAERMNYFADYVTHLICGIEPEENDLSDANELYEIPAVSAKWVLMCAKLKRLLSTKPYVYSTCKLFSNLTFCFSCIDKDRDSLWGLITYNGGVVQLNLDQHCTHLVTTSTNSDKYLKAEGQELIVIVTPDWIIESHKNKILADVKLFHPKLITWPKVIKHESTTAITGFEPEQSELDEKALETSVPDSTQALLDKLKQRMPWNQPQPVKIPEEPPPNVVAPSFTNSKTPTQDINLQQRAFAQQQLALQKTNQTPISSYSNPQQQLGLLPPTSQVPRNIVHHTPQNSLTNQPQQPQQFQTVPFSQGNLTQTQKLNRVLEQFQQRPNLQAHLNRLNQMGQQNQFNQLQRNQLSQLNLQNQQSNQETQLRQMNQQNSHLADIDQHLKQANQRQQLVQAPQQFEQVQSAQQPNQLGPRNQHLDQVNQLNQGNQQLGQMMQNNQHLLQNNPQLRQINQLNQINQTQVTQADQPNQQAGVSQLQIRQSQQSIVQHPGLGSIPKPATSIQQQLNHLTQQQLLNRQIIGQNQHVNQQLLKTQQMNQQVLQNPQQILQNHQNQLLQNQNQLNQQQQQTQLTQQQQRQITSQQQQNQINQQQLLQSHQQQQQSQINQLQLQNQPQINQTQLAQQRHNQLEQQMAQNQLNQQQRRLGTGQLNPHLLQNQINQSQLVQQQQIGQNHIVQQLAQNQLGQQPNQLNQPMNPPLQQVQQQIEQNQLTQQQMRQNQQLQVQNQIIQTPMTQTQLNQQQNQLVQSPLGQQQLQNKLLQGQFAEQQIPNQQERFTSPSPTLVNQQQFNQQNQHFAQTQPANFNQMGQGNQQLIQNQQQKQGQFVQNQQIISQQMKTQPQQQQIGNPQIVNQQQLINQKINAQQQINNPQQHILINQQQQQINQGQLQQQNVQQFPQQNQPNQPNLPAQQAQQRPIGPHLWQQQQQQQQQQINIRHPNVVQQQGPRVQWPPNQQQGVRQFIQLDAQTHQQLQQMSPEQRALFVAKLQKQRQLQILQSRMQQQQQQRGGHILIRGGPVPLGLNPQQQMQLLQQHAKQGVVFQSNIQQTNVPQTNVPPQATGIQHTPGLSPIQQNVPFTDQNQQLQLQRQQFRIQQLQLQREQVQKAPTPALQPPAAGQQPAIRPVAQPPAVDPNATAIVDPNVQQNPLVVNPKTKTALANMLSIRLQSGGSAMTDNIAEPSAAGTLRLMTAQHNAALNSNNRTQDLLTLQQRRIINRPSGELIRPPPAPSAPPTTPQVEPAKLQFSPRNSVPLQHRPGTYYGHNPNLKLPPDLFLLGCVFVVVELERFLDESLPGWQKKIEKHGGEIEKQYCNRVTHVICETQRHGVVMQALRDFKRCVTLYWLMDVLNRKQVLPPWIALHLPTMYWDTSPASKHLICMSGYTGIERDRVKHMIKYIGAELTTYFSKHNTLLIVSKAEGPKYLHAKKWGTPIVNVQWLTDVMLGHFSALNQMEHIKYQQFGEPANFSFDPLLVPNLMHAWKMPINISQESYEKVKRSASPVVLPQKPKKLKTEHMTDENDNEENSLPTTHHRILFSMCADTTELKKIVRQLGGSLAISHRDCTHLVMPQLMRSHKLLHCICLGTHIVPESWLRDSHTANKFLDESNYSLDTKEFNSEYKCDFAQTLATKNRNKLFEGKYFFLTPSVFPSKQLLVELIQSCSGVVERTRRTLSQIEATNINSPYSYVILTHVNDLHLVADLLKNKKDKVRIVCNVELIFSAILKQTFEVEPYAVKVL